MERHLRVHVSAGYYGFAENSPLYYAPSADGNARLALSHRLHLPAAWTIDLEAGGGIGIARDQYICLNKTH